MGFDLYGHNPTGREGRYFTANTSAWGKLLPMLELLCPAEIAPCSLNIDATMSIDVPQHQRKGSAEAGDADRGRGASSIRDAGRLFYTLTVMSGGKGGEAEQFGISEDDRKGYVRLDSAKVNLLPSGEKARWFHFDNIPLGNPDATYPDGDFIGVAVPWTPPPSFDGTDRAALNRILDKIAEGIDTPKGKERYSASPKADDRAAWKVYPTKTEAQCRNIIGQWIKNELLREETYHCPNRRGDAKGLAVDNPKRP
jgi:hypothetical protein